MTFFLVFGLVLMLDLVFSSANILNVLSSVPSILGFEDGKARGIGDMQKDIEDAIAQQLYQALSLTVTDYE